jgi:hypothetical protein
MRRCRGHARLLATAVRGMGKSLKSIRRLQRSPGNPATNALQMCHSMLWATEPNLRFYVVASVHPDHLSSKAPDSSACPAATSSSMASRSVASCTTGKLNPGWIGAIACSICRLLHIWSDPRQGANYGRIPSLAHSAFFAGLMFLAGCAFVGMVIVLLLGYNQAISRNLAANAP